MNIYAIYGTEKFLSLISRVGIDRKKLSVFNSKITDFSISDRVGKGLNNFAFIGRGESFEGQKMLEFGTGKSGVDLLIAFVLGFKSIYTVDINNHLHVGFLKNFMAIEPFTEQITETFDISEKQVTDRLQALENLNTVDEFLNVMGVQFVNFDNLSQGLADVDKIDLWYSESNLQRLALDRIREYFEVIGSKFYKQTRAFHRLDLKDIHQQAGYPFSNPSMHRLDYLKHSEDMWKLLSNPDYGYQNRLRYSQFISIFQAINLKPVKEDICLEQEDIQHVKQMKLPDSFQHLTVEQVAINKARILLTYHENKKESGPHYLWA